MGSILQCFLDGMWTGAFSEIMIHVHLTIGVLMKIFIISSYSNKSFFDVSAGNISKGGSLISFILFDSLLPARIQPLEPRHKNFPRPIRLPCLYGYN